MRKRNQKIYPKNICDMASLGMKDDKYKKVLSFFERNRDWGGADGDIWSYKDINELDGVEAIEDGKIVTVDGHKIISTHPMRQ